MYHFKFFSEAEIRHMEMFFRSTVLVSSDVRKSSDFSSHPSTVQSVSSVSAMALGGITTAEQIIEFRYLCYDYATKASEGLWGLMTEEQKKLALLYYDTAYWQHKLAFVDWMPYALPAAALAPRLMDRFANDLAVTAEWMKLTLPFTQQRRECQDSWESMHGMQTERFDSKVIRMASVVGGFLLGVLAVAFGDVSGSTLLTSCSSLLSSAAFGSTSFGLMLGGTYGGFGAQETSKQGLRICNKLRSGLPFNVLEKLTEAEEVYLCEQLSISCSPWSWLNKLRIRLASGDTYLPAKAWVKDQDTENVDQKINADDQWYRVDKKLNTYSTVFSILGAVGLGLAGFFLFGPLGVGIGILVGLFLGYKFGSLFTYHAKVIETNPTTAPGGLNQVLYERLEHVKYKELKHNIFTHVYKSYYRNVFENIQGHFLKRLVCSIFFGTVALLLDAIKIIFTWPRTIIKNCCNYFSPGQIFSKLQFVFYSHYAEYQNYKTSKETVKFVGKLIGSILLSTVTLCLKLPKLILGAVLSILNPVTQTTYFQHLNELQQEKEWLKQEMNLHGLSQQYATDKADKKAVNETFTARYYDHLETVYKKKAGPVYTMGEISFEKKCEQKWNSFLSLFGADPTVERRERDIVKWNTFLSDAGCRYVI